MLSKTYNPSEVEPRLSLAWQESGVYHFALDKEGPVYSIDTPPPTVSGRLHLGHVYSYSHPDFVARFWRMNGYNVYYPMGYDDNGLPTERLVEKRLGITATQVGRGAFIEKCLEAQAGLKERIPGIRTLVLCGPRIDPKSFGFSEGVEFRSFIPDPMKLYAACDLAIIQGGLSTAMELTALERPFLYFPLKDHFEQQDYVDFRLKRYEAGIRMEFDGTTSSRLAEAIAIHIGSPVKYKPVNTDGAAKASSMIIDLLQKGRSL